MARWNKTCKEFKDVREMIDNCDTDGIMKSLIKICDKYSKADDDFADDFEELMDEMQIEYEDNPEFGEDECDYQLSEFYDLCDAARVWLGL